MTVLEPVMIAAGNCLLLTGDRAWLDFPRQQLDRVVERGEVRDGWLHVPYRHCDSGWCAERRMDPRFHTILWYLSQEPQDWERLMALGPRDSWDEVAPGRTKGDQGHAAPWIRYLEGGLPHYPESILQNNYAELLRRLDVMAHDDGDPNEWDVHHWQEINPVGCEALVQLTLGAPMPIYHGGLLHSRLRWFDPEQQRPGLPDDVAVLVDRIDPADTRATLVNLDPVQPREVVAQAGMFGEHRFETAAGGDGPAEAVGAKHLRLRLAPGATMPLRLTLSLYAETPSYAFPWHATASEASADR